MDFIDSQGRLFGRVNIIDALVVLLVLAMAAAGAALATSSDSGPGPGPADVGNNTTQYVTVTFSTQPEDVAASMSVGDRLDTLKETNGSIRVVDLFRTPVTARDERASVVALLAVNRSASLQGMRAGERHDFVNGSYQMNGSVTSVSQSHRTLATDTTTVSVETQVPPRVANAIGVGDRYRVANETVGRITNVTVLPNRRGQGRVWMTLQLETLETTNSLRFGGRTLRLDSSVPFKTGRYEFTTTVEDIGNASLPYERGATPIRLESTVSTATADAIDVGDEYVLDGRTVGTVESVSVFPTTDSSRKRVQVGLTIQTVNRGDSTTFVGQTVSTGGSVRFATSEYTLAGTVINRGSDESLGTPQTITTTVRLEGVSPVVADSIVVGATERSRGDVYAEVLGKRVAPATVVLTADNGEIFQREHPVNEDVTLTVELAAQRTDSGYRFHGDRLQNGEGIVLDLGSVTVEGTVLGLPPR